jgi:hypothetical protein
MNRNHGACASPTSSSQYPSRLSHPFNIHGPRPRSCSQTLACGSTHDLAVHRTLAQNTGPSPSLTKPTITAYRRSMDSDFSPRTSANPTHISLSAFATRVEDRLTGGGEKIDEETESSNDVALNMASGCRRHARCGRNLPRFTFNGSTCLLPF